MIFDTRKNLVDIFKVLLKVVSGCVCYSTAEFLSAIQASPRRQDSMMPYGLQIVDTPGMPGSEETAVKVSILGS